VPFLCERESLFAVVVFKVLCFLKSEGAQKRERREKRKKTDIFQNQKKKYLSLFPIALLSLSLSLSLIIRRRR